MSGNGMTGIQYHKVLMVLSRLGEPLPGSDPVSYRCHEVKLKKTDCGVQNGVDSLELAGYAVEQMQANSELFSSPAWVESVKQGYRRLQDGKAKMELI